MGFITAAKVAGIKLTDKLNKVNDPFDDFTRQAFPKSKETLAVKAFRFEQDIIENFRIRAGTIVNYRIPLPAGSPLDLGDQALHHGLATAAEAMKLMLTDSITAVSRCAAYAIGMEHQQPNGILIRGIDVSGNAMLDASNDQATGHLFGLFALWRWGPSSIREGVIELMDHWAGNILANGHALINPDGRPTTYGQLINGWKTDPLRLTLCLAIYATASAMTGSQKYTMALADLLDKYESMIAYPKVKLWWIDTVYDTHRAAIHLAILSQYPHPTISEAAKSGLFRIREMVAKDGNIWVNELCAFGCPSSFVENRQQALKVLSEFDVDAKEANTGIDNSIKLPMFGSGPSTWMPRKILWNGVYVASEPLPRHAVRSQDFFWQRNLRSLDVGSNGAPADSRHQGVDYLCAYRLGLINGTIGSSD